MSKKYGKWPDCFVWLYNHGVNVHEVRGKKPGPEPTHGHYYAQRLVPAPDSEVEWDWTHEHPEWEALRGTQ